MQRKISKYEALVTDMLEIPKNADTRDTTAIIRLSSAYLKLLFPHVKSIYDITKEDFETYCFMPAFEKRRIIRNQLSIMDMEYSPNMPDIRVKDF